MNKSYRINTDVGSNADKHIKIKLEQEFDSFQILSLDINQKDIYQNFNSDYGVIVGRVNANKNFGIPNVKISIFVSISDEDALRPEIKAIYPYESPRQKNSDGKRYNLLPRVSRLQSDGNVRPKQPFGTFPTKEEFLTNDSWVEVYEKYYKYSTVTNKSGDFMLFGVPVGTQTLHMSVDITDIADYSMTPSTMVTNLGYSPNLFLNMNTRIKESSDLDDLPNIETQEVTVDVIPFNGDSENFDIGITRQDFRIRGELTPTFTIFGTSFTDGDDQMWGEKGGSNNLANINWLYRMRNNETLSIEANRVDNMIETIYVINPNLTDDQINDPNFYDPTNPNHIRVLSPTEYSTYKRNGDFIYILPCNRKKVITNELGEFKDVPNDFSGGIFTEFKGFITFEYPDDNLDRQFSRDFNNNISVRPFRYRYKFPQSAELGKTFSINENENTQNWRRQHTTFKFGKFYSVAQHYSTIYSDRNSDGRVRENGFHFADNVLNGQEDQVNNFNFDITRNVGSIASNNYIDGLNNELYEFPYNVTGLTNQAAPSGSTKGTVSGTTNYISSDSNGKGLYNVFGGNWMNFCIHFIQAGRARGQNVGDSNKLDGVRYNAGVSIDVKDQNSYLDSNRQIIAGTNYDTKLFVRSDLHWTDFIEVPVDDINNINKNITRKGFYGSNFKTPLIGNYRNGLNGTPYQGGRLFGKPENNPDPETYFYKGFNSSNVFQFLIDLGLVV